MMPTPIPRDMDNEIKKSVHILKEFTASSSTGLDKLIPDSIFAKAKGIAIISYCKMGFFISARGGSGIVVAKLPNGKWSAPSAVGIAGIGGGLEFGAELTAIIMMLMYSNAVKAFMKGKNVALGGGIAVAAGPIGRDLEADFALKSPAVMYTYAKAKGLFVGINLCGTLMLERRKANERCYGPGIRAYDILSGRVEPPPNCQILHDVLKDQTRLAKRKGFKQAVDMGSKMAEKKYGIKGLNKFANKGTDKALTAEDSMHKQRSRGRSLDGSRDRSHDGPRDKAFTSSGSSYRKASGGTISSLFGAMPSGKSGKSPKTKFSLKTRSTKSKSVVKFNPSRPAPSRPANQSSVRKGPAPRPTTTKKAPPRPQTSTPFTQNTYQLQPQQVAVDTKKWCEALYPFTGLMSCDISFQEKDRIEILTQTSCEFDWWEGRVNGKVGIFPANYVRVVT